MEILKIIILGIIEGITEWLPISSTGHLLLFDSAFKLNMSEAFKEMFFVVIQFGAILSVVVLYWKRLWPVGKVKGRIAIKKDIINMWVKVIIALLPSVFFGLLLDDWLETNLYTPLVIAAMLILYGIIFIVIEQKERKVSILSIDKLSYKTALIIGFFQVLSLIPGTSRSGATIIGGLLVGASRAVAAEFTFFLGIPTMFGASVLKLAKFGFDFTSIEIITLLLGSIVSFIVSILAIRFLINYIKKHDFKLFGWYRIILGIVVIIVAFL